MGCIPFSNFYRLVSRQPCSICNLILNLISTGNERTRLHPRLAAIDPEVQGTALEPVKLASGEEILQAKYNIREVGSLRILNADQPPKMLEQARLLVGESSPSTPSRHMDERVQVLSGNRPVNFLRLNKWLNNCDHNHGRHCNGNTTVSSEIPIMHIDVIDECLVRTNSGVNYFALSYI